MGLDKKFNTIRSQILAMEPLPPLNRKYALIVSEEKQLIVTQQAEPETARAFFVRKEIQNNQSRGRVKCDHCNKMGHTSETCFEIIGYPKNWQPKGKPKGRKTSVNAYGDVGKETHGGESSGASSSVSLTVEQYERLLNLLDKTRLQV